MESKTKWRSHRKQRKCRYGWKERNKRKYRCRWKEW